MEGIDREGIEERWTEDIYIYRQTGEDVQTHSTEKQMAAETGNMTERNMELLRDRNERVYRCPPHRLSAFFFLSEQLLTCWSLVSDCISHCHESRVSDEFYADSREN